MFSNTGILVVVAVICVFSSTAMNKKFFDDEYFQIVFKIVEIIFDIK